MMMATDVPCQSCGRCSRAAGDPEGWAAAARSTAVALTAPASAAGSAPLPSTPSGLDAPVTDEQVAALVRRLVRDIVGGAAGGSAGIAAGSGRGSRRAASPEGHEIPVGVSVRHLHICPADLERLYGPGAVLTKKSDLYEPGEFASEQVVTIVGPKLRTIENVRILGPVRDFTQVELSRTDGVTLGIDLPMRRSGDLRGAAGVTVVGPRGSLTLPMAIRSNRHIHMGPDDAARFGVGDNDIVRVRVPGDEGVIYENVQVRVKEGWLLTMHVDTDDANASNLFCNMKAYLLPS